jgi:hypothetical protein
MNTPMARPITGSTHSHPHRGRHDDPDRAEHVGQHLQVCPTHVQTLAGTGTQHHERGNVDEQADRSDHQHGRRGDVPPFAEPDHGLIPHVSGNGEQQSGVDQRGQDLQPVQTEGALRVHACG